MRIHAAAAMALLLLLPGCDRPEADAGPTGPPLLPGGYRVLLDGERMDPGQFVTAQTPDGIRFTTGPAGIAWRPSDTLTAGDYRAEGTLTLMGAPVAYREAYGLFVGGRELESSGVSYLYLLVRATGDFTIRRRAGGITETLVEWLSHNAVQRVAVDGETPVNTLAIEARGEETRFLINGTVVFIMPTQEARPHGVAGLRVNHRLDVVLNGWSLGPPPAEPPPTSAP